MSASRTCKDVQGRATNTVIQISFTPLVSPAVTPLETQYPVEGTQFTVPGVYFSPLTSPALHAQTEGAAQHYEQMCPVQASHSPTEMDTDDGPVLGSSSGDSAKKGRKSTTAPKPRGKQGLGKSPISRPQQKRKTASSSTAITSQIITELKESGQGSLPLSSLESENDSVSPENVSDMPPPPMPQSRSAGQSPYVQPQTKAGSVVSEAQSRLKGKPSPATPASLMNLTSPNVSGASVVAHPGHDRTSAAASDVIENFELPPPSAALPPKHATSKADSAQQSPALVAGAKVGSSSAFQPLPSPAFAMPRVAASTSQSPQLLPGSGSTGSSTTPTSSTSNPWKTPQMTARGTGGSGGGTGSGGGGSKKRSSVVSTQASPALRPRISPNIKPLLPASGPLSAAAEDTASRLLMTKSNYQNIIEGNAVPGVSYPSELSTNLTQKRTNHKIAEQGRRNRINSALQEIATLLPPSVIAGASSSGGGKGGEGGDNGDNMAGGATTDDGAYSGEAGKQQQRPPAGGDNKSTGKKAASTQAHQTPNSKASTVELAIEYIKQLKKEVAEATRRAEEAERKLSLQKNAARPSTESGATQADCPLESGVSSTSTCGKTP